MAKIFKNVVSAVEIPSGLPDVEDSLVILDNEVGKNSVLDNSQLTGSGQEQTPNEADEAELSEKEKLLQSLEGKTFEELEAFAKEQIPPIDLGRTTSERGATDKILIALLAASASSPDEEKSEAAAEELDVPVEPEAPQTE